MGECITKPIEVLIVDDDPAITEALTMFLERKYEERVSISEADSGKAAASLIRDGMIVLLDLEMPKMNGYEFLVYLDRNKVRPAKIVNTGSKTMQSHPGEHNSARQRVNNAYAHHEDIIYVPKPINADVLTQSVSNILG